MTHRIGAALLFLACVALPIIIIDYIRIMSGIEGGADASMTVRAEYAQSMYSSLARGWRVESLAISFVATAGLILMHGKTRAGWALAVVGALVTMPMYPIMLGGYGEIFTNSELDVDLFVVLRGIASVVFYIGQALMMLGFAFVLAWEIKDPQRHLPKWLLGLGAFSNFIAGMVFLLLHFGLLNSFMIGGPFGIVGFTVMAIYAVALFRRSNAS